MIVESEPLPRVMLPMEEFIERLEKNLKPSQRTVIKEEEKMRINHLAEAREAKT